MSDAPPGKPPPPAWRVWAVRIGRIALAVIPLWWVFGRLDWNELGRRTELLAVPTLVFAFGTPLVSMGVGALRWKVLLRAYGGRELPPFWTLYRHVVVGFYFNLLPGAVAGDALRAYRTRDVLEGAVNSLTVVFAERVCGLIGLLALGAASLVWSTAARAGMAMQALAMGAALALVLSVAAFAAPAMYQRVVRVPSGSGLWVFIDRNIRKVPPPHSIGGIAVAILLSLGTQGIAMAQIQVLIWDLAPEVSTIAVLQLLPVLIFLTYVPITPGAVGQRELVFVHLLGAAGVSDESAVAASLIVLGMFVASGMVGGAVYLLEGSRGARHSVPPAAR